MGPAITLAIETSNPSAMPGWAGEVCAAAGDRVVGVERLRMGDGPTDDLMSAVDRLFARAGLGRENLRRVVWSAGPGGFTSLRIAAATVKMLAEALGAEVVSVPTAAALATAVRRGRFAVALASKGETAWVAVYERQGSALTAAEPGRLMGAAEVAAVHADRPLEALVADAHLAGPLGAWARSAGVAVEAPAYSAEAVLRASAGLGATEAAAVAPIYPREPEAVTKWRALRGGAKGG